jgi:hypothetical protein
MMAAWEYAQLLVIHRRRLPVRYPEWSMTWYWPDASGKLTSGSYEVVVSELNRATAAGWEIVNVVRTEPAQSDPSGASVIFYTFSRPGVPAVPDTKHLATAACAAALAAAALSQPSSGVALFRLMGYCCRDQGSADTGRLIVQLCVAGAGTDPQVTDYRQDYEDSAGNDAHRHRIMEAASDYAASQLTHAIGASWWAAPDNFALAQMADLLDRPADLMRGLVEHPLTEAAYRVGVSGPLVSVGAGITANFAMAPLTAVPDSAARICEVAGIIVGVVSGIHPLAIACAKRLVRDELGEVIEKLAEDLEIDFNGAIVSMNAARNWVNPARVGPSPVQPSPERGQSAQERSAMLRRSLSPDAGKDPDAGSLSQSPWTGPTTLP